ncbi:MAG: hypothetical protein IT436_11840 [Phycisphaerales bacterium]|nr:hypothetical protein [Phycisphaerales bacterium]
MTTTIGQLAGLLERVAEKARASGVFGSVEIKGQRLVCVAKASAEPAAYRVEVDGGKLWVSLVMADRWLSESIESDLMHTGDKLEELLEEELVDQGYTGAPLGFEHYRSDDKLFTFRSALPVDVARPDPAVDTDTVTRCLLGYEACFRNLGDMNAGDKPEG